MNTYANPAYSANRRRGKLRRIAAHLAAASLAFAPVVFADGNMSDYESIPPLVTTVSSGDMPNVMVILDNSNSMDEAPSGEAVGSDNPGSKSEIARNAVKDMVSNFQNQIRMGLMAYQQESITSRHLHNSAYDVSYDPVNYDSAYTGNRDSLTKAKKYPNPTSTGDYVHYNVSLPMYSTSNLGTAFCYSDTADFDNGSETVGSGPWDEYRCFGTKTGDSNALPTYSSSNSTQPSESAAGYSNYRFRTQFSPTDSDYAQNLLDFGRFLFWEYVGATWFSNTSPGRGYVHVPIDDLDATQAAQINAKLATSQFSTATDTPLRNAGLTPLEGTLKTAQDYFNGTSLPADEGGPTSAPPVNTCSGKDFVILVTDGLPSVDENGNATSDTAQAIADVAAVAKDMFDNDNVRTYVIGFALPTGVSASILDDIATAGGTAQAYNASNASSLNSALRAIFNDILNRTSSSTAAAVVANSSDGTGALYQALFNPSLSMTNATTGVLSEVTWVGTLHSLFIDDYGFLREDGNGDNKLDSYDVDKIVRLEYDPIDEETKVRRINSGSSTEPTGLTPGSLEDLDTLKTIWNARDQLAEYVNLTTQRNWSQPATPSQPGLGDRYVFSWIDNDASGTAGEVDSGEVIDFTESSIDSSNFRYLGVSTEADANDIVNFIRGAEISGYRSRSIDYDQDGTDEVWRLGDIIHSSPVAVGAPAEQYDTLYGDDTYADFKAHYANRRQVIYIGANDGMLHAFNGGFWNASNQSFDVIQGTNTQFELGEEMWAYVPQNLLPHLQWLADTGYNHVYYMDGPPVVFDARIFPDDADHPHGWGTVLVMGMRFGGGTFSVDTDGDSVKETQMRSAYVVLDITNPEADPKGRLIAEITDAQLGFTTSRPTVVKSVVPGPAGLFSNATTQWYLTFGNGPDVLSDATSTQTAKFFAYDLNNREFVSGLQPLDLGDANSFVGNVSARDWNLDYIDDAVYFGTVGGTPASATGNLKRVKLDTDPNNDLFNGATGSNLLTPGLPIQAAPSFGLDSNGNRWVHVGTGRFFAPADNVSTQRQAFYGVKELSGLSGTVSTSDLQNVTDVQIFEDGSLQPSGYSVNSTSVSTYTELRQEMENKGGWVRLMDSVSPSERVLNQSLLFRTVLLFTSYLPSGNSCLPEGTSRLYALDFRTGTALPHGALGLDSNTTNNGFQLASPFKDMGQGMAADLAVHQGDGLGGDKGRVITQSSTGAIFDETVTSEPVDSGRRSWRQLEFW